LGGECTLCASSYVYESGQDCLICAPFVTKREKRGKKIFRKEQKRKEIVTISTPEFANRKIIKTLGIVSYEHILE